MDRGTTGATGSHFLLRKPVSPFTIHSMAFSSIVIAIAPVAEGAQPALGYLPA